MGIKVRHIHTKEIHFSQLNCVLIAIGIEIPNEQIPSGVYSALENANLTDSVLNSYNDVKLRWIAKEKWTYSIDFNGKLIHLDCK